MARQAVAALGSLCFLVVAPGTVAGLLPYLISGWEARASLPGQWVLRPTGGALLAVGLAGLLECFARFAVQGRGTPSPTTPTEHLVVTGLYRFVRNPMYLAVVFLIGGQALLLGSRPLLLYAGATWLAFHAFVLFYEEPVLGRRFGGAYHEYRRHVRRWWPRRSPWHDPAEATDAD